MLESQALQCREIFATWGGNAAHAALPLLSCGIHRARFVGIRHDATKGRGDGDAAAAEAAHGKAKG